MGQNESKLQDFSIIFQQQSQKSNSATLTPNFSPKTFNVFFENVPNSSSSINLPHQKLFKSSPIRTDSTNSESGKNRKKFEEKLVHSSASCHNLSPDSVLSVNNLKCSTMITPLKKKRPFEVG